MRTAEAEIHGRLLRAHDELCQIIPCPKPGEDPVSLPAPGNYLFPRDVTAKVPPMLLSVTLNATMQALVIPTEGQQYTWVLAFHVSRLLGAVGSLQA